MLRLFSAAATLSIATVVFLAFAVPRLSTGYEERAVRAELRDASADGALETRAQAALADGDLSLAIQYAEIAEDLGEPLPPEITGQLEDAQKTLPTLLRHASDFAGSYVTGNADSAAGLAGAVMSDLTVVGDVRDIVTEGGKAALGEDYSQFLLSLAAVGLAAEGAALATGGGSLILKAGISVLKVAKRTGNLTTQFSAQLLRLARNATRKAGSPAPAAQSGARATAGQNARATTAASRADLRAILAGIATLASRAGAADTVKLMRYVRTGSDVKDLAAMAQRFGRRTRAVVELTGKTALRAFRVAARGLKLLIAFFWSMFAWIGGLLSLRFLRFAVRGVLQFLRGAFATVVMA